MFGSIICNWRSSSCLSQVYKTGVTHYFNMEEAKRDFNYTPEPRDLQGAVQWFKERGHGRRQTGSRHSTLRKWAVRLALAVFLFLLFSAFIGHVN